MKEKELWKSVGIYKGADLSSYEASTFGNIRSVDRDVKYKDGRTRKYRGVVLSQYKNKYTGYMQVTLCYRGRLHTYSVHELVMNALCCNPNPEIYTDINHIDEDKTNNRLDNLEWVTHKENVNHGTAIERHSQTQKNRFTPIVQLSFDSNIISVYYKTESFNDTEFIKDTVVGVIRKNTYIYKDYFWIRLDEYNSLSQEELLKLIETNLSIKEIKRHKTRNKSIMQFSKNGTFIKEYSSIADAAREIGCSSQGIQSCAAGKLKTCKGYKWKYK